MRKFVKLSYILQISFMVLFFVLCSCGSLEQWSQGLQAVGSGLSGQSYYNTSSHSCYSTSPYSTTSNQAKEWHNCSQCNGSGRCKYCAGTGYNNYTKNKECGVCRGNGKCVGCKGKGGWKI